MDCTATDIIGKAWLAAQLAVAGGIFAIGALTIHGIARLMNRWRRWDQ